MKIQYYRTIKSLHINRDRVENNNCLQEIGLYVQYAIYKHIKSTLGIAFSLICYFWLIHVHIYKYPYTHICIHIHSILITLV